VVKVGPQWHVEHSSGVLMATSKTRRDAVAWAHASNSLRGASQMIAYRRRQLEDIDVRVQEFGERYQRGE
jgi:hypothetical protein